MTEKNRALRTAAAALGRVGGRSKSKKKLDAIAENRKRSGRPRHAWGRCRERRAAGTGTALAHECMGRCRKAPPCRCAWCGVSRGAR